MRMNPTTAAFQILQPHTVAMQSHRALGGDASEMCKGSMRMNPTTAASQILQPPTAAMQSQRALRGDASEMCKHADEPNNSFVSNPAGNKSCNAISKSTKRGCK